MKTTMHKYLTIIDLIWGDGGKGIVSYTDAEPYDAVVRFQGGPNAGHTIKLNDYKYVLHSMPCGVLYQKKICIIAGGCVVDPKKLIEEIEGLKKAKIYTEDHFYMYETLTIITPYEIALDTATEENLKKKGNHIGTTKSGIGTAYAHRAIRNAIIAQDFLDDNVLRKKIYALSESINPILKNLGANEVDPNDVFLEMKISANILKKHIVSNTFISELQRQGKSILFEGAQGILLDPLNGTFPYVTSFPVHPSIIGTSCGIDTRNIHIVGIQKAYVTRVGEGPFPTEIGGDKEEFLRQIGNEFGATTGRPRKCGWFDGPILRYSLQITGTDEITMTCFDTLYKMGKVKICTAYQLGNKTLYVAPGVLPETLSKIKPIYEEFTFDDTDISGINKWNELPVPAKGYIKKIQDMVDVPITRVKTGPGPKDIIRIPK